MIRVVTLALLLAPLVASAQTNVRGVCVGGGVSGTGQITAAERCLVSQPGAYTGGDTIYFKSFVPGMFTQTIPPGQLTFATDSITPYALYATAKTTLACTHLRNLALSTDSFIAPVPNPGTIIKAWCITSGTLVTAPTIHLAECSSSGASCSDNTTSALTCDGAGASTTTFGGAAGTHIDADDWMQLNLTNTPSVTDGVTTFCYSSTPD